MHKMNRSLHKMNFFDGHIFVMGASHPKHGEIRRGDALYYGIQYNHSGRFTLQVDGGTVYRAEGPYAFFTSPGHFYEYGAPPGEFRSHHFICSEGPRMKQYVESGLFAKDRMPPLIPVRDPEKFLTTLTEILSLMRTKIPPRAVLLYEDLLLQLYESDAGSNPRLPMWQEGFFVHLVKNIREKPEMAWDFREQAANCNITATHFRRLFKLISGFPPQQFLIRKRLDMAARLLAEEPHMSIGDIAEACGFRSIFYFSRVFHAEYHVCPQKFRCSIAGYRGNIS